MGGIVGCVGLYVANGATLLVGIWWRENKNKIVEWKAFVDTVRIESSDLEDKFLFQSFAALRAPPPMSFTADIARIANSYSLVKQEED